MTRRLAFGLLLAGAIAALVLGIARGDPETIHRFASQI